MPRGGPRPNSGGKRARAGRHTKFDKVAAERIVQACSTGAFRYIAARWAGISRETLNLWLRKGRSGSASKSNAPFAEFYRRVIEAEAQAEVQVGAVAFKGASTDPDYAMKYLRIRWRDRWTDKQQVEVSGRKGGPIETFDVVAGGLAAKLRRMEQLGKGKPGGDA